LPLFLIKSFRGSKTFLLFVKSGKMKVPKGSVITSAEAIVRAIKIIGSERALAKLIGVNRQSFRYWKLNTLLPCDMAIKICVVTGGRVGLTELRPDLEGVLGKWEALIFRKSEDKKVEFISKY